MKRMIEASVGVRGIVRDRERERDREIRTNDYRGSRLYLTIIFKCIEWELIRLIFLFLWFAHWIYIPVCKEDNKKSNNVIRICIKIENKYHVNTEN